MGFKDFFAVTLAKAQISRATCEPFALVSGLNRMPLNLATPDLKLLAKPDASAFGSRLSWSGIGFDPPSGDGSYARQRVD